MSGETSSNSRMHGVLQIAAMEGDRDFVVRLLNLEEPQNHSAATMDQSEPAPEHTDAERNIIVHHPYVTHSRDTVFQIAAMKGDSDVLVRDLNLEEPKNHFVVTINRSCPAPKHMEAERKIIEHLHSVTQSGDTVLHILVINRHNELAAMAFKKDKSLLKAPNFKMHETPLHYAAKDGNNEIIATLVQIGSSEVKEAARVTNCHGNTALHEAAKYGHDKVIEELMKCLDQEVPYDVNNEGLTPLYVAIAGGYTSTVITMLQCDYRLAKLPNSNGSCPVHVAAQTDNQNLIVHFMQCYPDFAKLKDGHGRNVFHILVEEEKFALLLELFVPDMLAHEMLVAMLIAPDNKGNTPLHTAAIKGDRKILEAIWSQTRRYEAIPNKNGETPFWLSLKQQIQTTDKADQINKYVDYCGKQFTSYWFRHIMSSEENNMDRTQVLGLGSVLITTVAFAAAFTVPGGLDQNYGTPIFGRKYIFKTFIVANTLAFLQGFVSLFNIVFSALTNPDEIVLLSSMFTFLGAAVSMVVAFGSGSYLMLAPVSKPLAILILVATLIFGSPILIYIFALGEPLLRWFTLVAIRKDKDTAFAIITLIACCTLPLLFIFGLGFL